MLGGIVVGLICAWILNLFGFGNMVISAIGQITGKTIDMAVYYCFFAAVGLISGLLRKRKSEN